MAQSLVQRQHGQGTRRIVLSRAQVKTELALLRSEMQGGRGTMQTKAQTVQERLESMQSDLTLLAQARLSGGTAPASQLTLTRAPARGLWRC